MTELTPKISVLLPVYNAGQYLKGAIESILSQDLRDFELLIADDGSTDDSLACIRHFADRDSRIFVTSGENRGLIPVLNNLIEIAKAPYIARMDADDVSLPKRFSEQYSYLESHPDCVAVGTRAVLIDEEGLEIKRFAFQVGHEDIDAAHMSMMGGAIVHPSVMMRREQVISVGGYRKAYLHAEDLDLFLRLAEVGHLANLSEVHFKYRQHFSSVGYTFRQKQVEASIAAVKDAFSRRGIDWGQMAAQVSLNCPRQSTASVHSKWAWWALSAGNINTAKKHAAKALRLKPLSIDNWRLMYCIFRGY